MHIAGEWLNKAAGVKFTHVPYRGVAPSVTDVVAGHVDTAWVSLGPVRQYINTGKLIPLAIADAHRSKLAPAVPTLAELGYKDFEAISWYGVLAPAGTPAAIVQQLNKAFNEALQQPDVIEKLRTEGGDVLGGTSQKFDQFLRAEVPRWGKIVKESGASLD